VQAEGWGIDGGGKASARDTLFHFSFRGVSAAGPFLGLEVGF
jgi:hypothetical protein